MKTGWAVLAVVNFLCLAMAQDTHKKPLKIVTVAHAANFSAENPMALNPLNSAYSDAAKMAMGEYEKRFANFGIEVRILNFDHGPNDVDAPRIAEEVIKSEAIGVVGFYQSGKALLAAPMLVKAGMQLVSPTASAVKLTELGPLIRTLAVSNRQMAEQMVKFAKQKFSVKRALVITDSTCMYCLDLESELKTAMANNEIQFINGRVYSSDQDLEPILKLAKESKYDVVFLPNQEALSAKLIQLLLKIGIYVPYVGGDGWGNSRSQGFFEMVTHPKFQGFTMGHWSPETATAHGKSFAKEWLNRFYRDPTNDWAMVYEATHFMLQAMYEMVKDQIPLTRPNLAKKIASIKDYDGMVSRFEFKIPGGPPKRSLVILKSNIKKKRFEPAELVWVE